jgi:hypothetical protein
MDGLTESFYIEDIVDYLKEMFTKESPVSEAELKEKLVKVRSAQNSGYPFDSLRSKLPTQNSELINQCMESLLSNAEAIAVDRLAFAEKIEHIVRDNSYLINIILHIGELLKIKVKELKYNPNNNEMLEYEHFITSDSKLTFNQLLEVAVQAKNILKNITSENAALQRSAKTAEANVSFKDGLISSLRNKIKELELPVKQNHTFVVIYNANRNRYLYSVVEELKDNKKVRSKTVLKSTKKLNKTCIFTNQEAEELLKKLYKTQSVKDAHNYAVFGLARSKAYSDSKEVKILKAKSV